MRPKTSVVSSVDVFVSDMFMVFEIFSKTYQLRDVGLFVFCIFSGSKILNKTQTSVVSSVKVHAILNLLVCLKLSVRPHASMDWLCCNLSGALTKTSHTLVQVGMCILY